MNQALLNLFNQILRLGHIPSKLKSDAIIPIPKKGSTTEITNYRVIAIQSNILKLLDKFITKRLFDVIGDTLDTRQHGIVPGRSTTTNLATFIHG